MADWNLYVPLLAGVPSYISWRVCQVTAQARAGYRRHQRYPSLQRPHRTHRPQNPWIRHRLSLDRNIETIYLTVQQRACITTSNKGKATLKKHGHRTERRRQHPPSPGSPKTPIPKKKFNGGRRSRSTVLHSPSPGPSLWTPIPVHVHTTPVHSHSIHPSFSLHLFLSGFPVPVPVQLSQSCDAATLPFCIWIPTFATTSTFSIRPLLRQTRTSTVSIIHTDKRNTDRRRLVRTE
ncbi:hypothetical protein B0H65DRAFT_76964 [Neurospora tetraspora]|uniref:Uncharacterized protein n=1 Tax=Neurospora tetraspora TaxID=94610 RepID=A0AAE0J1R6_9PEZI|nr:hypothetical protein B0H65DRAFT_76964 [Neurospora tetraspora]